MSKWKCDICKKEFENFHAQGFDNKIYCPLCFFKEKTNRLQQENERLKEKIENKDDWCQLIADIGFDYDGFNDTESLKSLIDELVEYALNSRNNYSYEEFLKEGSNE